MNPPNQKPKNHLDALVALTLVPQLGIQRIRLLLQAVDHPAEIFMLSRPKLETIDGIGPALSETILHFDEWDRVENVFEKARQIGATLISYEDDRYPPLLRQIYDPPVLLWVKGAVSALSGPAVAVVGTRRATTYGLTMAGKLSDALAKNGLTVISGLAYGIDAAAHKATLAAGGKTIAVLGSGIDVIYPQKHAAMAADIIETGGAVITEFTMGTPPDAGNFPERNRIVSGLSLGTLVVESGLKGGSMITAQSALMQNREVFVVPHSLENANGIGCNHLIKRGAGKLVQTVEDILEELPMYQFQHADTSPKNKKAENSKWESMDLDEESRKICDLLTKEAMHIDALSAKLEQPSHHVLARLLELEMMDCVRQTAGKNFELV